MVANTSNTSENAPHATEHAETRNTEEMSSAPQSPSTTTKITTEDERNNVAELNKNSRAPDPSLSEGEIAHSRTTSASPLPALFGHLQGITAGKRSSLGGGSRRNSAVVLPQRITLDHVRKQF